MSNINFDNPWLLLIAVPLIVLFTVPFLIAVRKDNRNAHNIASQIMHVFMALIIAFAAAGTSITTVLTETHVYVVADVSYSANKNLDTIDNIIKNELVLPRNSKVGIITFGKDYELLCNLTSQKSVKSVKESIKNGTVDDSETNIAEALEYAGTLFKDDVIKRVVLITDGRQTDEVDTSAMRRAVDSLESQNVKVDAYFLDDNLSSDTPEVQISGADFTASAYRNHAETVNVNIRSNVATHGMIRLYRVLNKSGEEEQKVELETQALSVSEGQNVVSFDLPTSVGGTFDYEVCIENLDDDSSDYNNNYSFTQSVSNEMKVLIVTGDWTDANTLVAQYEDRAAIDVYENSDINLQYKMAFYNKYREGAQSGSEEDGKFQVRAYCFNAKEGNSYNIPIGKVPFSIEELCQYDEIVLSNVDIRKIENSTNFIQSLDIAVSTFGKSLVTYGDTYIQSESSHRDLSKLSDMLPVRYGQTEGGKMYTIIIDSSRSMFMGSRLSVAKEFAIKLLGTLQKDDRLGIVGFYGNAWTIRRLSALNTTAEIEAAIKEITVKQGTVLSGALNLAYNSMKPLVKEVEDKQLMIITDGRDSEGDYEESRNLVSQMFIEDGIVTSVIDVGRDGDYANDNRPDTSNSSYQFIHSLAIDLGHGKYFYHNAQSNERVPDTTFGQMAEQFADTVVEKEVAVTVNRAHDNVLNGLPVQSGAVKVENVSGYIVSSAKASATTVLHVKHVKEVANKEVDVPLYAYWTYGNGKVSTFASKPTGNWIKNWNDAATDSGKSITEVFLGNVLYENIPNQKADYPFTLSVIQTGSATHVNITPHRETLHFDATAKIQLILPNGDVVDENLVFDKDHYFYDFKSAEVGKYQIAVTYSYMERDYSAKTAVNVSYASEYDAFTAYEASPLFRAVNGRGQVVLEGKLTLENEEHEVGTYTNDFTLPLLVISVILFVVDIIVRKLKWEDIVSFFGGFKKSKKGGKK